jgi:hypothetical protein
MRTAYRFLAWSGTTRRWRIMTRVFLTFESRLIEDTGRCPRDSVGRTFEYPDVVRTDTREDPVDATVECPVCHTEWRKYTFSPWKSGHGETEPLPPERWMLTEALRNWSSTPFAFESHDSSKRSKPREVAGPAEGAPVPSAPSAPTPLPSVASALLLYPPFHPLLLLHRRLLQRSQSGGRQPVS